MLQSSGIGKRWQLEHATEGLEERSLAASAILFAKKTSNRYKLHCVKILEAVPYDVSLESIGCSLMKKKNYNGQGHPRHWKSGCWDQWKANATFLPQIRKFRK